jgi:hypothetical protein
MLRLRRHFGQMKILQRVCGALPSARSVTSISARRPQRAPRRAVCLRGFNPHWLVEKRADKDLAQTQRRLLFHHGAPSYDVVPPLLSSCWPGRRRRVERLQPLETLHRDHHDDRAPMFGHRHRLGAGKACADCHRFHSTARPDMRQQHHVLAVTPAGGTMFPGKVAALTNAPSTLQRRWTGKSAFARSTSSNLIDFPPGRKSGGPFENVALLAEDLFSRRRRFNFRVSCGGGRSGAQVRGPGFGLRSAFTCVQVRARRRLHPPARQNSYPASKFRLRGASGAATRVS